MIKKNVGIDLRRFRDDLGLTQEDLSHNADVAIAFLKEIEAGKKQPTVTTLFKLAYALGITPDQLILPTFEKWKEIQD